VKKKKVVITGGLGYIGVELCKLYSGEAWYTDIIVNDSRFCSERVSQLRDWGMSFVQADIMDREAMKEILEDADVVIHLAGITDVAYTKTEEGTEKDKRITEVGIDGTRNIINLTKKNCRVIFPSTHVVYEGFKETTLDISEGVEPKPELTYSTGKVQSEVDLAASEKNYIILRLATVCGYSSDTMRLNIMPNLFSKIASQNGTIRLFSGGVQLKSLVPLVDVARCFKFMAENHSISREIFHCSSESMTVKEVANICKEFQPNLTITETDDEIPNLGYTISNQKLLATGFEFLYTVKDCIREMVENWSQTKQRPELEYTVQGAHQYMDERGTISNYELTEPINLIGLIDSKKGAIRANHYHPIQEQKCLLISGKYISVIKDLSTPNAPISTKVIYPGDVAIIKPNVAHTMVFTEDSVFLNLVRGERDHENYGITHTIPKEIVSREFADRLIESQKTECRSCGVIRLERVVSLGSSPLANNLISTLDEIVEEYPLEMDYCSNCHNCQLSAVVNPRKMFDNYLYVSSTTKKFRAHFEDAADKYIQKFKLGENSTVVDVGSNDGIALKPLMEHGVNVIGVEPAANIAEIANGNGVKTINAYFDESIVDRIGRGKADLVTASNVFAHSDDLKLITRTAFSLLKDDGTFIVEVQYLLDTINDLTFDNIYHEHVNYWSVISINSFFEGMGLYVASIEKIDTHGGSIRVYVCRDNVPDKTVEMMIKSEEEAKLLNLETYRSFGEAIEQTKQNARRNMDYLKANYERIVGYGAPAKATTALNYFGITSEDIQFIIEDNELKCGKFIPGVNIPIKSKSYIKECNPELIIVMAWNFFDVIKEQNAWLMDQGTRFISIKDIQKEDFDQ
jgi:nucleoside-diphosphate-sugar epimerase/SAM-dependent methyltransferase/quercetin dioxygenase-like cupin family protein